MNHLVLVFWIGLAGAIGAISRYGTNVAMSKLLGGDFPLATLTVNVIGCFCLGCLAQIGDQHFPSHWKVVLGVGFLGALTTFSTFGVDTVTKLNDGQTGMAFLNVGLNVLLGLGAVAVGMSLVRAIISVE